MRAWWPGLTGVRVGESRPEACADTEPPSIRPIEQPRTSDTTVPNVRRRRSGDATAGAAANGSSSASVRAGAARVRFVNGISARNVRWCWQQRHGRPRRLRAVCLREARRSDAKRWLGRITSSRTGVSKGRAVLAGDTVTGKQTHAGRQKPLRRRTKRSLARHVVCVHRPASESTGCRTFDGMIDEYRSPV
jgi:hypothetical protein